MSSVHRIGVIGAGAWGTALAKHLAVKGLEVRLWAYEREVVDGINKKHENQVFLPGVALPSSLLATGSLVDLTEQCEGLLFVVPSHVARSVLRELVRSLPASIPFISA
ncbi:MAG TPA: NAD(P)-binding domain-containing protein, partial [Nitrospiraceae bacterium]|nr:NAD(P)-binding domain-containing protein [Nitrospiraceae bacterium]